ncbi:MAG: hypothetical protein ACX930_03520 [Erythrobacter sp.]
MAQYTRIGALAGFLAASSMAFTPAYAAEMFPGTTPEGSAFGVNFDSVSPFETGVYDEDAENSEYHRRYYRHRRYHRRNRIDGGDVLAGVLILGGIAAIASAASRNNERRRYEERRRYDDRRYDDRRYDNRRSNPRRSNGTGLDSAVSQCLAEIEQDARVETVDGASRLSSGWIVSGTLFNGTGFSCEIDNNGRISNIDYGGYSGVNYQDRTDMPAEGQWSEASYAEARAATGIVGPDRPTATQVAYSEPAANPTVDGDIEPQPAYPGGPLPGEEGYDQ